MDWDSFKKLDRVKGEKIVDFTKTPLELSCLEGEPLKNYILTFEDTESIDPNKTIQVSICASHLKLLLNNPGKASKNSSFNDLNGKRLLMYYSWHFDTTFRPIQVLDLMFEDDLMISIGYFQRLKIMNDRMDKFTWKKGDIEIIKKGPRKQD